MACFRPPGKSSCPAARIAPACASMLRRRSIGLELGSTVSRSFSLCCAGGPSELLSAFGQEAALNTPAPVSEKVLDEKDVAAVFGLKLAEIDASDRAAARGKGTSKRSKRSAAATSGNQPRACNPHTQMGKRKKRASGRVARAFRPAALLQRASGEPHFASAKFCNARRGTPQRPLEE
jgi:hypothetical protein